MLMRLVLRWERLNISRLNWRLLEDGVVAQALSFRLLTISTTRMALVALVFVVSVGDVLVKMMVLVRLEEGKCGLVRDLGLRLSETSRQQQLERTGLDERCSDKR